MAIKSLSVKIGADTKDFQKGLRAVNREIRTTERTAKQLEKGLDFEYDEKRFLQTQKLYQNALDQTEDKAEAIRKQLQFLEKAGAVDTAGYRKLETELAKAETKALGLRNSLEKIDKIKLEQVTKQFTEFGDKATKAGQSMIGVSAAAGGALYGMYRLGQGAREAGDDIATMAVQYDLSTEAIQRFNYIALQGDVATDRLFNGANRLRDALGAQMRNEVNASTRALEELSLSSDMFESQEDALLGTIQALSNVTDSTVRYNLAVDLFGQRLAADILPLIEAGSESIAGWSSEFDTFGTLTDDQVQNLAKFDEEMNKVTFAMDQAKIQLGVALIPVFQSFADLLQGFVIPAIEKLTDFFSAMPEPMQKILVGLLGLIAVAAPLLIIVGKMSTGIAALIPLLLKLKAVTTTAAIGFGALGGALTLSLALIGNWSKMSTVTKILTALGIAALAAAAAVTVFQASWSLGLAIGAIAAGVTAGIAAISAAQKKIYPDEPTTAIDGISSGATTYDVPTIDTITAGTTTESITNNNLGDIIVNVTEPQATAEEIADAVSRAIAIKMQARR